MPKSSVYNKTKALLETDASEVLRAVIETPFWPKTLEEREQYQRLGDDTKGYIEVIFTPDNDGHISVLSVLDPDELTEYHRFRTYFGGGQSLRVRNALLVLAQAIVEDNKERPQHNRKKNEG